MEKTQTESKKTIVTRETRGKPMEKGAKDQDGLQLCRHSMLWVSSLNRSGGTSHGPRHGCRRETSGRTGRCS